MTNFFSSNPKGEDCNTCLGDLSFSCCCLGTLGQQRGLGCHQPPWLPNSSGPWEPKNSAQAPGAAGRDPEALKPR